MGKVMWMSLATWYPWIMRHMAAIPVEAFQEALGLAWCNTEQGYWLEDIQAASTFYYHFEEPEGEPITQTAYGQFLIPLPDGWALCEEYGPGGMAYADFLIGLPDRRMDGLFRHIAPVSDMMAALR